jgi:carotenoid cleavage dioxygenase-like enzyme
MAVREQASVKTGPQAGYETLDSEVVIDALEVKGTLPPWLTGTLLRNGPALFEDRERRVRHWFDGQAMLHRFTIAGGAVSYANRFLRTKQYEAMRSGRLCYSEFATDPCRSIFKRAMTIFDPKITDSASVSIGRLGDEYHAMTEAPMSVRFDPQTLQTLGYGEHCPGLFATAHPHYDPASGAQVNIATQMGPHNSYRFFVQSPGRRPKVLARKGVLEPGYIHSFAMSERYIALTEFPFVVRSIEIPLTGRPFIENFRWKPERGTRIFVFDRHTGRKVGRFEMEAGFAFHHVGAWDHDDQLVMEYCDHGTPAIIDALYLDKLRAPDGAPAREWTPSRLRRVTIDLAAKNVSTELRSDHDIELPRINDAHYLRPYRYVYGFASGPDTGYDTADRLVKIDNESGEAAVWREESCYAGEPIFVAAPNARDEDDGVVLSVVLDAVRGESYLVVLDARSMTELARARAPHVIPHGIHGAFFPER